MYIIYKALNAVKLAQRYGEILSRPVVPCFWMATDDHDFEEVRSANFLLRSGETRKVTYDPAGDPTGHPIADIVLDSGVNDFCSTVSENLIDTEFKKPLLDKFKEFYAEGNKLSEAFAKVLNTFLGNWGIVLIDPNFPGLKSLYKDIFVREIEDHDKTFNLYQIRSGELTDKGYHAQVHKSADNLNIFYQNPLRVNVTIDGEGYRIEGAEDGFTQKTLLKEAADHPELFSTNVLLRPIAQCKAFPTLAHIVGPSELAYFAQIEPLYSHFEVPFPIAIPRAGMTIIEPHIRKILNKYDLDLLSLKNELEPTIGRVVERLFPSEAAKDVFSMNDCMKKDLDELADQLKEADPEGQRHVKNFKKHIDFELKSLRKKLKASNKKRHEELTGQIRRAHAFLFPNNGLQERIISPLYYANKFGPEIFEAIYESLVTDKPAHTILEL